MSGLTSTAQGTRALDGQASAMDRAFVQQMIRGMTVVASRLGVKADALPASGSMRAHTMSEVAQQRRATRLPGSSHVHAAQNTARTSG